MKLSTLSTRLSTVFTIFIGVFVFAMTVSAPRAFANTVVQKECDGGVQFSSGEYHCYFFPNHSQSIGYDGVFSGYGSVYPSSSFPAFIQIDYQNSNTNISPDRYTGVRADIASSTGYSYFVLYSVGSEDWVYQFSWDNGVPTSYVDASTTRFIQFSPYQNEVTSSTTVDMTQWGYVSPLDISSTTEVKFEYENEECTAISGSVIEAIPNAVSSSCVHSVTYPIDSDGFFSHTVTDSFNHNGTVYWVATLSNNVGTWCLFGNCLFTDSVTLASRRGIFVVATTSAIDRLNALIASSTATDVITDFSPCYLWSSTGDVLQCLRNLFLPSSNQFKDLISGYSATFLQYPPMGYVTLLIKTLNNTTSTMPPPLSYTFGSSSPAVLQGQTYTMQIYDHFDTLTSIRADDGSNKNIWDITMPYFRVVIGFATLWVIINSVINLGLHGSGVTTTETGSESVSSSAILPTGERKTFVHSITKRRRL